MLTVLPAVMAVGRIAGGGEAPVAGGTEKAKPVTFASKPEASRQGDKVTITFAVSAATDVEVAVLDAKGSVVRHLAAGLLGANAPSPFGKDSLSQRIEWDMRDDEGRPAAGGPFRVRVRIGVGARLNRFIPARTTLLPPHAMGVGPEGTLYVLASSDKAGGACIYALSREGKYLRTILPSPAGLKKEQVRGLERLRLADGSEVPIVYSAYIADTAPYLAGIQPQQLAVSRDGWIVFASGGNNWTDQIVPRHALVLKCDGTTPPEVGFIGPPLGPYHRYSTGLRPQQIALSPDGKTIYFAGMGTEGNPPKGIHCIGRTTWDSKEYPKPFIGKPDEPGTGGEHLNDPRGIVTDDDGNVYVADYGNNRIAAFDAGGRFLGETRVAHPGFFCVHPKGTALYVGSSAQPLTGKHEPPKPYSIVKFDKAIGGKEIARYEFSNYRYRPLIALDAGSGPPKLWLSCSRAYGQPALLPLLDEGDKLVPGEDILRKDATEGFTSPLFLAADPARNRLYVGDFVRKVVKVDLASDRIAPFLAASEAAVDREGNVYALMGYGTNALCRFTGEGKPANFPGSGTNKIEVPYRAGLPHVGVRGVTVAPNGDIYVFEEFLKPQQLHVFGPDGKLKKKSVIADIPTDSANGIAVDRDGNIYIGVNVHDPKNLYPDELAGQLPPYAWERTYPASSAWYGGWPQRKPPDPPWNAMYLNNYLYHYGNIFKFGPEGGRFWTGGTPKKDGVNPRPEGVPADAAEYRTGLLGNVVWASGAKWVYRGFALAASRTENSGDPTCSCLTSRFGIDEFGRLWVPDVFRFRVTALDSAGNELTRVGGYGNVDSAGPNGPVASPPIPLASPNAVAAGGGRLYIADRKNRRIVVADMTFAAEAACEIK
ncbi:MAG: hypothetical protein N3A38_10105 [Planctomycetota bacterium]|nr:hypothetical protein [Planctomycetota bacterium]